jgi:hypothetical protein
MLRMVTRRFYVTREEQKTIIEFVCRAVNGANETAPPPMDIEADAIIRALFVRNPEAAYRVTMLAINMASELETLRQRSAAPARFHWLSRFFKPEAEPLPPHPQIGRPEMHPPV